MGENAPAGASQRSRLRLDDRGDPLLDPAERLVDAQQSAAEGEAIIAQLRHRTSPASWRRMKLAIALASDSGSQGLENSARR